MPGVSATTKANARLLMALVLSLMTLVFLEAQAMVRLQPMLLAELEAMETETGMAGVITGNERGIQMYLNMS